MRKAQSAGRGSAWDEVAGFAVLRLCGQRAGSPVRLPK